MRFLIFFIAALFFSPTFLFAHEAESIKVVVVGDTGIGERAFHPGFVAVQKAMRQEKADAILHLGDFVYQPKKFPTACDPKYIDEIKEALVQPYAVRIFVAGDNDLPPQPFKPKASGCWNRIAPLATPFDTFPAEGPRPGKLEGVMHLETALFVILDVYDWQDPAPWLKPLLRAARHKGMWIIFALHEPAVTTAWYEKKRRTILDQINRLKPDLVFAGNQHSYERFFPMGIPREDGALPVVKQSNYAQGAGVTHIVSGGGGATFKPFADQQGHAKRSAPETVFDALAKRALMFHYLTLDIAHDTLNVTTRRVCPTPLAVGEKQNPRWHADDAMWHNIPLACDGQKAGVTVFDQFKITR